jgi:hypothetical protein
VNFGYRSLGEKALRVPLAGAHGTDQPVTGQFRVVSGDDVLAYGFMIGFQQEHT